MGRYRGQGRGRGRDRGQGRGPEREGNRSSWVQKDFSKPHPGSIPIAEIKASDEWQARFESEAPKRKYALCVGYLGSNYQGLQINPDAITVECVLEKALLLAGGMPEVNFGNLQKLQWSRAARTDRGVHAVTQCCSMKLTIPLDPQGRENFRERVNSFLPADIRVLVITKCTKNFSAKVFCTKRRYQYYMPTYLLTPVQDMTSNLHSAFVDQGLILDAGRGGGFAEPGSTAFLGPMHLQKVRDSLVAFRASPQQLQSLRAALKGYEGTNPYHNFTTGKAPSDSNVKRFVVEFECDDPVVDESTGVEWVLLSVLGQSFLLNQIRKMVGLAVDIARGATSIDKISDAFSPQRLDVPMAPGQGLFLDELFFEGYNIKIDNSNNKALKLGEKRATTEVGTNHSTVTENTDDCQAGKKLKNESGVTVNAEATRTGQETEDLAEDGDDSLYFHEPMQWASSHPEILRSFRDTTILPHVRQLELSELPFLYYLDYLRVHVHQYVPRPFPELKKPGVKSVEKPGEEVGEEVGEADDD